MQKARFTEEPDQIVYLSQADGSAEVWLRTNIEEVETEEGVEWQADEVQFNSRLSEKEILDQAESYFVEEPEVTTSDLVEAINILADMMTEV